MTPAQRIGLRVCIVFSLVAFTTFYLLHFRKIELGQVLSTLQHERLGDKEAFVKHALQTPIEGPFNKQAISELCASTTWTPGLVFKCDPPQGGVGNVENVFLNCVRYAIEAGGAFIVPQIMARSPKDLSDLHTLNLVGFDYLFDLPHFKSTLTDACPQMKLYDSVDDLRDYPTAAVPIILDPGELAKDRLYGFVLAEPGNWRASFDNFLKSKTPDGISSTSPVLVQIQAFLQFPRTYDPPDFVHNFGRIFRFREDARTLAASVLFNLTGRLPPHQRGTSKSGLYHFFGAHLRVAADAIKVNWPGYDKQAEPYLEQAIQHDLSTIYVATGSVPDMERFRSDAAKKNCVVLTKADLLSGDDLEALNQLNWDQHALVDLEVLLKSSQFGGIEQSSFAWKVAARRHLLSKNVDFTPGTRGYEDEFSVVYGIPKWPVFPLAMWP